MQAGRGRRRGLRLCKSVSRGWDGSCTSTISFSFVSPPGTLQLPSPHLSPPLLVLQPKVSSGQVRRGKERAAEGRAELEGMGGGERQHGKKRKGGGRGREGPGSQEKRGGRAGAPPLTPQGQKSEASLEKPPSHSLNSPSSHFPEVWGKFPKSRCRVFHSCCAGSWEDSQVNLTQHPLLRGF